MEFLPVPGVNVLFAKYETTNADWHKFQPAHDSGEFKGISLNDDRQPVVKVSWEDCHAFCKWLTETERAKGLR